MRDGDDLERIARLGDLDLPVGSEGFDDGRQRALTMLMRQIDREHGNPTRPRVAWRGRRTAVAAVLGVGLCSAGGIGYAALSAPEKASAGISCHSDGRLDGSQTILSLDGRSAVTRCAQEWRDGIMVSGSDRVPPLQACVDPQGDQAIHVFATPDPEFCARFSMRSEPTAGTDPGDAAFVSFAKDVESRYAHLHGCATEAETRALIRSALEQHRMSDWTVTTSEPFTSAEQCAGDPAFDSTARRVYIFPAQ